MHIVSFVLYSAHVMAHLVGLVSFVLSTCLLFFAGSYGKPVVDQKLYHGKFPASILVTMRQDTREVMADLAAANYLTIGDRRRALYAALRENADSSQAPLLAALNSSAPGIDVSSFWISNQISIRNADTVVLDLLCEREDVTRVELVEKVRLEIDRNTEFQPVPAPRAPGYNLDIMGVPEVWNKEVNGTGVVVGILDTGVRHTHAALRDSYKNDSFSWHDPITNTPAPSDDVGHGTMTMALLAGGLDIGVAPGAKWVACKAFDDQLYTDMTRITSCFLFFACPDPPGCLGTPRIMCNSLNLEGIVGTWDTLLEYIELFGVLVVSSAGDYGAAEASGCSSLSVPSESPTVLSVGATDSQDALWTNSSKGPSLSDEILIKPDVTAPGVNVISACISSDTPYCSGSGTNRAAPQVAGVAALLLSMVPWLSPAQVRAIIKATAEQNLKFSDTDCGGIPDSAFPNFQFGYGRLDALAMYDCVVNGPCLDVFTTPVAASSTVSEDTEPETTSTENPPGQAVPWLIIAAFSAVGALFSVALLTICWRRRRSGRLKQKQASQSTMVTDSDEEYDEESSVDNIVRQFRQGVWPQMSALRDVFGLDSLSGTDAAIIGNYIALTKPYKLEKYEIGAEALQIDANRVLGSGEFGVVYAGTLRSQKWGHELQVGIKKLKAGADENCVASFLKELQVMIYVGKHPNIVQLLGACTQSNYIDRMCIVLRLCTHGNLEKFLRAHRGVFVNLFAADARKSAANPNYIYMSQSPSTSGSSTPAPPVATLSPINSKHLLQWAKAIASGMEFIARKKVVHGDLACRNVLLDENLTVKISDFGLASRLYEYTRYVKTAEDRPLPWKWMAPESLQDMKFSMASDVWAFGIAAWEIFTLAEVPYPGMVWCREFLEQLVAGYRNVKPRCASEEIYTILKECWRHNPADRPTMANLKEKLLHIIESQFPNPE